MNLKWLALVAIAALLLTQLPASTYVAADEDLDDTVEGEELGEDTIVADEEIEDAEEIDYDDLELGPTKDVNVTALFPEFNDLVIPAGAIVSAVIGVDNQGETPYIVQSIQGAIGNPLDFQSFQNFSEMPVELRVDAGEQATFTYRFRPSERFEPRDFLLTVVVNLKDKDEGLFVNTAFNQTVTLTDPESEGGVVTLLAYGAIAVAAAVFYMKNAENNGNNSNNGKKSSGSNKKAASKVETGTNMTQENEWLQGTNIARGQRQRKASEKSRR